MDLSFFDSSRFMVMAILFRRPENFLSTLAFALALVLCQPAVSHARVQEDLRETLQKPQTDKYLDAKSIRAFYEGRDHKPVWTGSRAARNRAKDVLAVLKDSWTHGLNPETYHVEDINALMEGEDQGRFELLVTDAVMRYARDMTGMRVNPSAIRQKASFWRKPLSAADILSGVVTNGDPAEAMEKLAPRDTAYRTMRRELIRMVRENEEAGGPPEPLSFGKTIFRPGDRHKSVSALRERLGIATSDDTVYDDNLAAAVMAFQKENGLNPDGMIGPKTLALLNRTNRDLLEQLVANMERLRWLDPKPPERYILVNIPSQMLWAIDNGKAEHEMRVVVGMKQRQTRDFTATVTGIRFNPTWTVPPGIKVADMLPKLQEDPYALTGKGIELYENGKTLDPTSVDWNDITREELHKIRMVQGAGDHNALGQVRVLMANDYDIYLHDTNHREFFAEDERTLSSGCVRLAEPRKIARFVLEKNAGWSDEKMESLIEAGRTVEVSADQPIPVYILYQTVWMKEGSGLVYGSDVYGRDRALIKALSAIHGYSLPGYNNYENQKPTELASAG